LVANRTFTDFLKQSNLASKVLHMFTHAALFHPDLDWYCRLDTDTLFLPANLRRFLRRHAVWPTDRYYLGVRQYQGKYVGSGPFPYGGAGVCISRGALHRLGDWLVSGAVYLDITEVESYSIAAAPCHYTRGHFDDGLLGSCFDLVDIRPHPALVDGVGRAYFSQSPLPCWEYMQHFRPEGYSVADRPVPWITTVPVTNPTWLFGVSPWFLLQRSHLYLPCQPAHLHPDWWMVSYPVSFHGFKKPGHMVEAYRLLVEGRIVGGCEWMAGPYMPRVDWSEGAVDIEEEDDSACP